MIPVSSDQKQQPRTCYRNSEGNSQADAFVENHRARAQPYQSLNHLILVSYSETRLILKSTVTWGELVDLGLIFTVLLMTETRRETLVVAKILVSHQFVTTMREGPGPVYNRMTSNLLVRYLF